MEIYKGYGGRKISGILNASYINPLKLLLTMEMLKQEVKKPEPRKSWGELVGIVKQKGDSVKQIRKIRWILSKKIKRF